MFFFEKSYICKTTKLKMSESTNQRVSSTSSASASVSVSASSFYSEGSGSTHSYEVCSLSHWIIPLASLPPLY